MTTFATNKTILLTKDIASTAAKANGMGIANARTDLESILTATDEKLYELTNDLATEVSDRTNADTAIQAQVTVTTNAINALFEAVVGSSAQVSSGAATHSTIQSAINAVASGAKITVLQGTYTGPITINKEVHIHGKGRSSVIDGAISVGASGTGVSIKFCRITDNTTINASASHVMISDNWIASGKTVSGGTNSFIFNLGE